MKVEYRGGGRGGRETPVSPVEEGVGMGGSRSEPRAFGPGPPFHGQGTGRVEIKTASSSLRRHTDLQGRPRGSVSERAVLGVLHSPDRGRGGRSAVSEAAGVRVSKPT